MVVAAVEREVLQLRAGYQTRTFARLRLNLDSSRVGGDRYSIGDCADIHHEITGINQICRIQHNAGLFEFLESAPLDRHVISAGRKLRRAESTLAIGFDRP